MEALYPGVVRRVLEGAEAQPRWLPRWVLSVVSADVDTTAGVGAIWLMWLPKTRRAYEHTVLLEWYDERWRYLGGGSSGPLDDEPVHVDVMEIGGESGSISLTGRPAPTDFSVPGPWVGSVEVHLGPDVGHLLVDNRRIDAPEQRRLIAAWRTPHAGPRPRPLIVAFGRDGTELTRIGPGDTLDTRTWAQLEEES
ncbi:hypothetical protein ACWC9R_24925 [Streptomyces sp. NPDC001219]